jgi:hypothetical protein
MVIYWRAMQEDYPEADTYPVLQELTVANE